MSLRTSRRSLLASGQVVDVQVPSVPISEIRARKWTKQLKTIGHLSIPKWVPGTGVVQFPLFWINGWDTLRWSRIEITPLLSLIWCCCIAAVCECRSRGTLCSCVWELEHGSVKSDLCSFECVESDGSAPEGRVQEDKRYGYSRTLIQCVRCSGGCSSLHDPGDA